MTCPFQVPKQAQRLYVIASLLVRKAKDIENERSNPRDDFKARARVLADDHGWDVTDARKIWAFGPDTTGANLLVDQTKASITSTKSGSVVSGFPMGNP